MVRNNLPLGMQFRTCEKNLDSADSQNLRENNLSLRDSAKQNRGNPPTKKTPNLQSGLPREQSSLAMTKNKRFAESSTDSADSAPSTQKDDKFADSATLPKNTRLRSIIIGANGLSLGISIVVAILLGIGAGVLMQKIFDTFWVLFLGVFWGIAAAILNVYKVYKAELRDFEKLANDPKYKY